MPFTFAHPAFALPIKKAAPRLLSATGLVLGSMAPDFEYFVNLEPHATIGHSAWGLLLHALPLSVLFAFLFHLIVKTQLALHLPSALALDRRAYRLLGTWKLNTLRAWIVFLYSVAIGFITHVVLDAFTHQSGYVVLHWPLLREPALFGLPVFKCLQHGLSLIGLIFVAFLTISALLRAKTDHVSMPFVSARRKACFWIVAVLVAALVAIIKLVVSESGNTLGILVVAPLSGSCLGLVVSSVIFGRRR
nr:DUF4184 family protein [Paenibacillus methanolicus]